MTTSFKSVDEGASYITSSIIVSIIALNPLAPDFRSNAFLAIALNASSSNFKTTPSYSRSFLYCFVNAFFGSVKILIKASSSRSSKVAKTGSLPMNSGIKPNFKRSSGCTKCVSLEFDFFVSLLSLSKVAIVLILLFTLLLILLIFKVLACAPRLPKPNFFSPVLNLIMSSSPTNAPPHMNRILLVSTCKNSCCGCFRPPFGGTLAIVPSNIFKRAC